MTPTERRLGKKGGRKKQMITVEIKKKIIEKHERGLRVADIARFYKKSSSTICTVLKNKEEIKRLDTAKGVTRVSKQRPRVLEDVEKLLLVWINEKQQVGDSVTENCICEKAKAFYADLVIKPPFSSAENERGFKASGGWFDNFKRRSGIHCAVRQGEAASSGAKAFVAEFSEPAVTDSNDSVPSDYEEQSDSVDPIESTQLTLDTYFDDESLSDFSVELPSSSKIVTVKTEPKEFKENGVTSTDEAFEESRYIPKTPDVTMPEENEFDCFGKSVACQLKKLPEASALESIAYIQSYLVKRRLQFLQTTT